MDDDQFYKRHASSIIAFFRGLVSEDAEDLVQETFVRFFKGRDRMLPDANSRAYLFGIARHVFHERLRELARERKIDPAIETMAALDPRPSTVAARRREHRMLREALRRLPIQHQEAMQLHYWGGLRIEDIAEIMGITHSGMRDRMCKARQLLEQQLAELEATTPLIVSTINPPES